MLKRFVIKKNEKGALLKDGDFERILCAGRHYFFDPLGQWSVCTATVMGYDLATSWTKRAIARAPVARALTVCPAKKSAPPVVT